MLENIPNTRLREVSEYTETFGVEKAEIFFGILRDTIKRYIRLYKKRMEGGEPKMDELNGVKEEVVEKNTIKQTVLSSTKFTNAEQLAEFCNIDLKIWEASKIVTNQWGKSDKPMWQFKVIWNRIKGLSPQAIAEMVENHIKEYVFTPPTPYEVVTGKTCLEIQIPDAHLGRFVASTNSDKPYNMQLAHDVYLEANKYFYEMNKHLDVEKVVMLLGGDFLNCDNALQSTSHGTPQIEESVHKESFDMAIKTAVDTIEFWRSCGYAVEVKIVAGNHDEVRMYSLGCVMEAQYKDVDSVVIDNSHKSRKYFVYGCNMIGFTHGKKDAKRLRSIYQSEMREYLSQCTNIEFHIGHTHAEKVVEDFGSVIIRTIPSLAQHGDWEIENGYSGNRRAQAFVWHKEKGLLNITYFTP